MSVASKISEHNPFATRYVRPGAIPYCFPAGVDAARLVERLSHSDWRGQIVGPHGSGKSTLLATLLPVIEAYGRHPLLIALHDGQRRLPERLERMSDVNERTLIVVDGYEQLGRWQQWRLNRLCRRRRWGLLVTTHRSVGLPTVHESVTTPELAEQLVERLTDSQMAEGEVRIDRRTIDDFFHARQGNLRELLFDCYDHYRRSTDRSVELQR